MDLDKTSEARRKAQRNGEEDPVVVAQRFLNIYRQIHIFNAEKKAAFNKMLLELSPQIRGIFGQLPGGAILQDYVDELAEKEGIEKSTPSQSVDIADEDVKQAKILATALAEAQVQASAKLQGMAAAPSVSPAATAAPAPNAGPAGTTKLAMDKNFAQEFASILSAAMQKNSATHETEIKTIIATLGKTQLEIIKVLQEENTEHREEMKNISKMMLQAQEQISLATSNVQQTQAPQQPQPSPKISEETKQLIKMLLNSQQQILERIAKVETLAANNNSASNVTQAVANGNDIALVIEKSEKNVGQMIAAFQERQKNDTLEIARLINESQQNLVKLMIQHNNVNQVNSSAANNNANNIQIKTSDYSAVLNRIADQLSNLHAAAPAEEVRSKSKSREPYPVETNIQINFPEKALTKLIEAQSQTYQKIAKQQTKELSAAISLALKESQKVSTQNIIEALGAHPIIMRQPEASAYTPAPIPQSDYNFAQPADPLPHAEPINLFEDTETFDDSGIQEASTASADMRNESSDFYTNEDDATTKEQEIFSSVSKADFEKASEQFMPQESALSSDEIETPVLSELPKKKKKKKKKKKSLEVPSNLEASSAEEIEAEASEIGVPEETYSIAPAAPETPEENTESASEETLQENDVSLTLDQAETKSLEQETSFDKLPEEESTSNSWLEGFDSLSEAEPSSTPEEDAESVLFDTPDDWGFTSAPEKKEEPQDDAQDWEWVYEEEQTAPDEDNAGEGIDWEWDYVPEDAAGSTTFHNTQLQPLAENCPIYSGNLFFQEHVLSSQPIVNSQPSPVLTYHPGILDSASADESRDPYKNSSLKD